MSRRGTSPVLGVVLVTLLTVASAGFVGATLIHAPPNPTPHAVLDVQVDAAHSTFTFVHRGGDTLSVDALSIQISVNGNSLTHQPPVPFFAATGFESGPTGPFNVAADTEWSAGEEATLTLAATNGPAIAPGDVVQVRVLSENATVAAAEVMV